MSTRKRSRRIGMVRDNLRAAIRLSNIGNVESIDIYTISPLHEFTVELAEKHNRENPLFEQDNPVVRIAKIEIREIVED